MLCQKTHFDDPTSHYHCDSCLFNLFALIFFASNLVPFVVVVVTSTPIPSIPSFVVSTYDKLLLGFVLCVRQALHIIGESLARDDIDDIGGV